MQNLKFEACSGMNKGDEDEDESEFNSLHNPQSAKPCDLHALYVTFTFILAYYTCIHNFS